MRWNTQNNESGFVDPILRYRCKVRIYTKVFGATSISGKIGTLKIFITSRNNQSMKKGDEGGQCSSRKLLTKS